MSLETSCSTAMWSGGKQGPETRETSGKTFFSGPVGNTIGGMSRSAVVHHDGLQKWLERSQSGLLGGTALAGDLPATHNQRHAVDPDLYTSAFFSALTWSLPVGYPQGYGLRLLVIGDLWLSLQAAVGK